MYIKVIEPGFLGILGLIYLNLEAKLADELLRKADHKLEMWCFIKDVKSNDGNWVK